MKNQRTNKLERQKNAKSFYQNLQIKGKLAVVIDRHESTSNPHVNRTQLLAVCDILQRGNPLVIAESTTLGLEGCFIELLQNIKDIPQLTLYENGFAAWLKRNYGFLVTYNDGFVMLFEV